MTTRHEITTFLSALAAAVLLIGCMDAAVTAINPLTGERRDFESPEAVPAGWIVCSSEETCPAPRPCDELDEEACLARTECSPLYVSLGAPPRECDRSDPPAVCDGESFAGCTDAPTETCAPEDCGPAPLGATWICPDGSVGGVTGRCIQHEGRVCGWEIRECPTPPPECAADACGPAPAAPAYRCWDGSTGGNTGRCLAQPDGSCGWEIRECPPEDCGSLPSCELACPPGTVHPVDDRGCVSTCECVPAPCSPEECGPAPLAPSYECADGSIGGNTGNCLRNAEGVCAWEFRECPDPCGTVPACALACPVGTHNPTDALGCVHTCECVPDGSSGGA